MSQKINLPDDVKDTCLGIYSGYDRRKKWYNQKREEIIKSGSSNFDTYKDKKDGKECRFYAGHSNSMGRPAENKGDRLIALEDHPDTRCIRAIDAAKSKIGEDVQNNEVRKKLVESILLNCKAGRKYPFERLNLTEFSRRDFYRRRDKFLLEMAKYLGFL